MKDKKKWIIGISACVLLMVSVFFVFNQGKSNEQVVTEYFELLKKKDYKQMYQMLNSKTVYTPTQKYFVEKYKEFLKDGGEIYFKTDDDDLFNSSLIYFEESGFEVIKKTYDLHNDNIFEKNIETEHEKMFSEQGIKIKALIAKI